MTEAKQPDQEPAAATDPNAYPMMIYRAGDSVTVWDNCSVDTLIVNSDAALNDALGTGWFMDPAEAVANAPDPGSGASPLPYDDPDNAPIRNTSFDTPQTGDLPDPPTSPAAPPIIEPIAPEQSAEEQEAAEEGRKLEAKPAVVVTKKDDEDDDDKPRRGRPPNGNKGK